MLMFFQHERNITKNNFKVKNKQKTFREQGKEKPHGNNKGV